MVSTRLKNTDGTWWDAYVASGGYLAAKKALSLTPEQIIDEVSRSNLRGLGGAGISDCEEMVVHPEEQSKAEVSGGERRRGGARDIQGSLSSSSAIRMPCLKA